MKNYFILRANTNDDYYDNRAVAMLVAIDSELRETITKMSAKVNEIKKIDPQTYKLSLFNYAPVGIPSGIIDDDLLEKLDACDEEAIAISEEEFNAITKQIEDSDESVNIDTLTMELSGGSVMWQGYYKHSNILVESGNIYLKDLTK